MDKSSNLPKTSTFFSLIFLILLIYAFFSGLTVKFYASILFFIYHYIQHMWIAVIGLGIFQTFFMVPFRIINLVLSTHIKEFESKVESVKNQKHQQFLIKQSVKKGDPTILWYIINFFTQTISYISIGKLFLTDFYTIKLNPNLLFAFSKYPAYPIKDPIFRLPYPIPITTKDYGWGWVFIIWGLILIYKLLHGKLIKYYHRLPDIKKINPKTATLSYYLKSFLKNSTGFLTLFFVIAYILVRYYPQGWELRIFSGDVSVPNYTLNAITAIGAFIVVLWLNIPKIFKKARIARSQNIPENIIFSTQKQLFKDNLRSAALLGIGAYYITRLIPSAFELSIFTLEVISLISPFTIDRLILPRFNQKLKK
ncbi:MAG: hypothetical protein U9Q63_03105 [Patescibacteria group bacterium]|nr:hypothetical protein [Patescibacteria group bacterium]